MIKKNFWGIFFISTIFVIDRITKVMVLKSAETFGEFNILVTKFLSINLIWNEGIAFGLFSFNQKSYYNFLTIIIIFVTLIILWMIIRTKDVEKFAFMMIFGGSLGNIFDRIYYSSVPDFIDIHFGNFHWFIFNVSDIFISIGVISMIILELIDNNRNNVNEKI